MNTDKPIKRYDQLLQVRVPADLLDLARAKSAETGVTLSHMVRQALEEWVNKGKES